MVRSLRKMATPLGIVPGETATLNLPLGLTYDRLDIEMNVDVSTVATDVPIANWGDYIDEVRLIVDGQTLYQAEASFMVAYALYHGQALVPGVLPLFLERPWMLTTADQMITSYGTANGTVGSLTMEIDLKAGITVNHLRVWSKRSPPRDWGSHLRLQRHAHNQSVGGEAELQMFSPGPYGMLTMHLDTAAISDLQVISNNRIVKESNALLRAADQATAGRTPQTGYTHVDFLTEDIMTEMLDMRVDDFRLKPTFTGSGPGAVSIYTETLRAAFG
ncbi:major capsid protein P2 [Rhodophyticola sp.]|jgi:hypothetical protein|uniref:major capsid protein P2 n=1 Tax=Rhodophyticola sp. TaxID=2680032 RepID=UPI003D287F77